MSAPVAPRPALTGRAASPPRTLLQTVFYFEHALRELPMDLLLGLAVAAAFHTRFPPTRDARVAVARLF